VIHLILVEPEIHWNTGNAGRTALAVGAELHLVDPLGFSLDEAQVRRAGLDYWPRVRLRRWPSWSALAAELPSLGEPFYFSATATRAHWDVDYPDDVALIFGRESVGLPRELIQANADRTLRIPMAADGPRSLNLSTAVAVAAYQAWQSRERRPSRDV
jgi:tRNA (cytidine/uridine-2'-O-)-methyltransferase